MESKSRPWRLSGRTFCCSPASSSSNSSIALSSSSRAWPRVSKARLSCCALSLLPTIGVSYNLTWEPLHYLYSLCWRDWEIVGTHLHITERLCSEPYQNANLHPGRHR